MQRDGTVVIMEHDVSKFRRERKSVTKVRAGAKAGARRQRRH